MVYYFNFIVITSSNCACFILISFYALPICPSILDSRVYSFMGTLSVLYEIISYVCISFHMRGCFLLISPALDDIIHLLSIYT